MKRFQVDSVERQDIGMFEVLPEKRFFAKFLKKDMESFSISARALGYHTPGEFFRVADSDDNPADA
jgi:hypothetical protein